MSKNAGDISIVLQAVAEGDKGASEKLLPLVYAELRALAQWRMKQLPPGQTLQPTALVHEAYLKVAGRPNDKWDGRNHFFGAAAQAMRDIVVDQARRKAAIKHGGNRKREDLNYIDLCVDEPGDDVLALDEALKRLESDDPRKGKIVNLRYFAGMTVEETASVLEVSVGTVERDWRYIKAWLASQLADK